MEYIVDMQGFIQSTDNYVLKELAILPLEKDSEPLVFLFQEPYNWRQHTDRHKSENTWLERPIMNFRESLVKFLMPIYAKFFENI